MLYLFHGDNALASRNAYFYAINSLKRQFPLAESVILNGEKITLTELLQAVEATSLLGSERIIQIENLLSRRVSQEKEKLISYLISNNTGNIKIILYESREISPSQLKKFSALKNIKISGFKLSKSLFQFLDNLKPKNALYLIKLFNLTIKTDPVELIMFMLIKRLSQLFLAKSGKPEALSDIRMDWQKQKLLSQANFWTEKQLVDFHAKLLEIDEAIKTGQTPADLTTHLDILLASL